MPDKEQRGTKSHSPKHEKEAIANASHVAKEERGLHETRHIRSCIVIVQAVAIDKQASRSTADKRPVAVNNYEYYIKGQNAFLFIFSVNVLIPFDLYVSILFFFLSFFPFGFGRCGGVVYIGMSIIPIYEVYEDPTR